MFSKEDCSRIENIGGNLTELVLQTNVYWLEAKFLDGKANSKLLRNTCELRRIKRTHHAVGSSPVQQLNIQEELIQAEVYGPKIRAQLRKENPSSWAG